MLYAFMIAFLAFVVLAVYIGTKDDDGSDFDNYDFDDINPHDR